MMTRQGQLEETFNQHKPSPTQCHAMGKNLKTIPKNPQQTVSAAHVFKVKPKNQSKKRNREPESQESIIDVLEDQLCEVGNKIAKDGGYTFDQALNTHLKVLDSTREKDRKTMEIASNAVIKLVSPLTAGLNRADAVKVDVHTSKSPELDMNIAELKKIVATEQENLERYWKEWEATQNEYLCLGNEVFGQESNNGKKKLFKKGFSKKMEQLDMDHMSGISHLEERIEKLTAHVKHKMRTSEKDLNITLKKDRAKILASLVSDL